jgi:hypothetical protein
VREAILGVLAAWDTDNRYPAGRIQLAIGAEAAGAPIAHTFQTDGMSFWDSIGEFFAEVGFWTGMGALAAGVGLMSDCGERHAITCMIHGCQAIIDRSSGVGSRGGVRDCRALLAHCGCEQTAAPRPPLLNLRGP